MSKIGTGTTTAAALALALSASFSSLAAQQQTDRGWLPFLGCWEPQGEDATEGYLCFVPDGDQVEMLTLIDGQVEFSEPFRADGAERTIEQDDCQGTESARFSQDRMRIYTSSAFNCDADASQSSTGIISMIDSRGWIDVRAMEADGEVVTWVQAYERVSGRMLEEAGLENPEPTSRGSLATARTIANSQITLQDVVDATRNVDEEAVQAWIAERGQPLESLEAEDLLELDAAGVSAEVIDVVVAVSFPHKFALNRGEGPREDYRRGYGARPIFGYGYGRSLFYDPFYSGYGYGYGSSFYSGYGYGYGGYAPVRVIVDRARGDSGGRVVNGRGYSRGRGSSAGGSSAPASRPTVGRSGGSARQPASRGGSGRKAKRRGGS